MTAAYLVAGGLALLGAVIHGGVGEVLFIRSIDVDGLPRTRLGGRRAALLLIRAAWHMLTIGFVAFGVALTACGLRDASDACRGVGALGAGAFAGFAAVAIAGPLLHGSPRSLYRHPAPLLLSAVAVSAWIGARA